jgi:hypothetical protein
LSIHGLYSREITCLTQPEAIYHYPNSLAEKIIVESTIPTDNENAADRVCTVSEMAIAVEKRTQQKE